MSRPAPSQWSCSVPLFVPPSEGTKPRTKRRFHAGTHGSSAATIISRCRPLRLAPARDRLCPEVAVNRRGWCALHDPGAFSGGRPMPRGWAVIARSGPAARRRSLPAVRGAGVGGVDHIRPALSRRDRRPREPSLPVPALPPGTARGRRARRPGFDIAGLEGGPARLVGHVTRPRLGGRHPATSASACAGRCARRRTPSRPTPGVTTCTPALRLGESQRPQKPAAERPVSMPA